MKYCVNCGAELKKGEGFCGKCGKKVEKITKTETPNVQIVNTVVEEVDERPMSGLAIAGFCVGILSLFLINLFGFVGFVGFILSLVALLTIKNLRRGKGLAIAGIVLGGIGIICGIIQTINFIASL